MEPLIFYQIIAELVDRERRIRSDKREYIASLIDCTESYIRKIHSSSTDKHYNLEHLYLLSEHWKININSLLPSISNLKLLPAYQNYSDDELENEMEKIRCSIKKENTK